jgi:cyclic-di-GMP-binding biofilm dispersal mediator protein
MAEQFGFEEKVALVAGGTGGLGSRVAGQLAELGASVVTLSRSATGNDGHITADLRSPGAAERAVGAVIERHGRLDIVVNAAGVVAFGDAASTDVDTVEEVFLTNTFAHIFLCQAALPRMTKGGVIVAVSGVVAEQNLPGMAVYGASKAATRSFNEAFAREARRAGIRVIDARPPHTETGLATRPVAGTAPKFPQGLDPAAVASRIVTPVRDGETDLPSAAFAG